MLPLRDNAPTRRFPVVTVGLIVANFVVFFWEMQKFDQRVNSDSFYPCSVQGPCLGPAAAHHLPWYESTFTSMFMHAGWAHILGNMLFLWIFGNNVEDALGRVRYLIFYLLAGCAATALQTFVTLHYSGAQGASIPNLGASGAIAGVLGAYFVLLPRAKVLTLFGFFLFEIPAFLYLGIWFGLQALEGNLAIHHPAQGGGVAVFAHIGGMLFGAVAVKAFQTQRPLAPSY